MSLLSDPVSKDKNEFLVTGEPHGAPTIFANVQPKILLSDLPWSIVRSHIPWPPWAARRSSAPAAAPPGSQRLSGFAWPPVSKILTVLSTKSFKSKWINYICITYLLIRWIIRMNLTCEPSSSLLVRSVAREAFTESSSWSSKIHLLAGDSMVK